MAVTDDLGIKQDLYRRIGTVRRPGCTLSSNTSTVLREALIQEMGAPSPAKQESRASGDTN